MIYRLVVISLVSVLLSCFQVSAQEENLSNLVPNQYIIEFSDSNESSEERANNLAKKHGLQNLHIYSHVFKGANVIISPEKLSDLVLDPQVKRIVHDFTISAFGKVEGAGKPSMGGGGAGQVIPTGINWIDAELNTTNEGNGATVAVLDTGIDFDHPDLSANINIGLSRDFTTDGTGGDDNNNARGVKGHGTHVAGVIAALDNTTGVLGTGSQINLVSVKVLDRTGSGTFGWVIAGLDYVTANANVIGVANLSLGANGGTSPSQSFLDASALLHDAVVRAVNAGVILVVAAGNSAVDVTNYNAVPAMYPEVVTVSALDDRDGVQGNDNWASFSNYGTEVDIIAPGVYILSTAIGGGTSSLSGTSFSAPHVAGTVGLYITRNGRPLNGDARLLSSLINTISQSRSLLSGEPNDGFVEPSCFANGSGLQ